jgi:hypothetical protein
MLGARPGPAQPLMGSLPSMTILYVAPRHPSREAGSYTGGNLPFIRPGLNGEVVPKAVLRRLRSGLLRSSPIWPSTARTYTAIHAAARGSLMQRLIRVELIIDS